MVDVSSWSETPASNVTIDAISIAEGCSPGNINNAIRSLMAGVKTFHVAYSAGGGGYAPIANPTFTGVPAAPTAAAGTNTTQLATTAFVTAADLASKPAVSAVSAGFTAADADNNTHKTASGATPTLTLGSITAGVSFTIRFTTAWSLSSAGTLSKNGAAPAAVTTGSVAANSLITFLHEGAGLWLASGAGLT